MSTGSAKDDDFSDRKMNDSTMPPPRPRSGIKSSDSSAEQIDSSSASPPTTADPTTNSSNFSMGPPAPRYASSKAVSSDNIISRKKPPSSVPIRKKGFGLSDWNRLLTASKDLALRRGAPLRQLGWKEIRQHKSMHDGWIVLKNKVYVVNPYLPYHPGGERILQQVLGKDVTSLYNKYHQWVNEEGYVKMCSGNIIV